MKIKVISKSKSGTLALGGLSMNEIHEDIKALARVWDLYGGLLKKHRLVHSSAEGTSSFNSFDIKF